jgi:hypothetical protein
MTLLNVLYAPEGSSLHTVGLIAAALDDVSHVLAWATGDCDDPGAAAHAAVLELPRVGAAFDVGADGTLWYRAASAAPSRKPNTRRSARIRKGSMRAGGKTLPSWPLYAGNRGSVNLWGEAPS